MFTSNPFAELSTFLSPRFMQVYVILMVIAVAVGTFVDMMHKSSARFFLQDWRRKRATATRSLGLVGILGQAIRTLLFEVAVSGELIACSTQRWLSHLLMFYGFLLYLISTVVLVFAYPTPATPAPAVWPLLWNLGALMVMVGGYWFFFFLRVNVAFERQPIWRLMRADLFIVSLLATVTFGLVWEIVQAAGNRLATQLAFAVYLFFATLLFVGVPWSKFAHMFYKPAAALQKRIETADGSTDLPRPAETSHIGRG
jgi:hypothetical protein